MWTFSHLLRWAVLFSLTSRTTSFLTVRVEFTPNYINGTDTNNCSQSFVLDLEDNLTTYVTDAIHELSYLSDFTIPGGLHLTYFDDGVTQRRRQRGRALTTKKGGVCTTCNSGSCTLSCGIGLCVLCAPSRRLRHQLLESSSSEMSAQLHLPDATSVNEKDSNRRLNADWDLVGVGVTNVVEPLIQAYVADSVDANGCLGDPTLLSVNVTLLSDVPFSYDMEVELIRAFGAPPQPVSAPTPRACCTEDFITCVTDCGTTQTECDTCSDPGAAWIPQGPPPNPYVCLSRGSSCLGYASGCCKGLTCIGDQYQQECLYAAAYSTPAPTTPAPTPAIRMPTVAPTSAPTLPPTPSPTLLPTLLPTPSPTLAPTLLPTRLPTPLPTRLPTPHPTLPPTLLPTRLPTALPTLPPTPPPTKPPTPPPTPFPTSKPTTAPPPCISRGSSCASNVNGCCQGTTCNYFLIIFRNCG